MGRARTHQFGDARVAPETNGGCRHGADAAMGASQTPEEAARRAQLELQKPRMVIKAKGPYRDALSTRSAFSMAGDQARSGGDSVHNHSCTVARLCCWICTVLCMGWTSCSVTNATFGNRHAAQRRSRPTLRVLIPSHKLVAWSTASSHSSPSVCSVSGMQGSTV